MPIATVILILFQLGHSPEFHALTREFFDWARAGGLATMLSRFQRHHGLAETGTLTPATEALLRSPRCAHPDVMAVTAACAWPQKRVTWRQAVALTQIPADRAQAIFAQAWGQWAAVCGIEPVNAADGTPVNVAAVAGDGIQSGFDLQNTILALSELPCGVSADARLHQTFNDREDWTEPFLLAVATHEIGHAIGLPHLDSGCVMAPYYNASITAPQPGDIAEAVSRYGPPASAPPAPSAPSPTADAPAGASPSATGKPLDIDFHAEAGDYRLTIALEKIA